ncbi:HNH endonuclease signature motif containing protein [Micrococcoides hystricis]|uniref:HNH endonuclease n=1 Tax=Micrococcoides hystricis TaxID=1572761 RepID=A0ABV6PBC2_9MICC
MSQTPTHHQSHPHRRPSRGIFGSKAPDDEAPAGTLSTTRDTGSTPADAMARETGRSGPKTLAGCGFCTEVASHVGFIDRKTGQPPTISSAAEGFAVIDKIQNLKRWIQAVEFVAVTATAEHAFLQKNPRLNPTDIGADYLQDSKDDWAIKNFISTLATRLGLEFAQARRILRDGFHLVNDLTETLDSLRDGQITIAQAREIVFQFDAMRAAPMPSTNQPADPAPSSEQGELPLTPTAVPQPEPEAQTDAPNADSATDTTLPPVPETPTAEHEPPATHLPAPIETKSKELETELLGAAKHLGGRRFKNHARTLREQKAPESKANRARIAVKQRQINISDAGDGMGRLTAFMPLDRLAMLDAELDGRARSILRRSETRRGRSYKQIRADEFAEIILFGAGQVSLSGEDTAGKTATIVPAEEHGQPVLDGLEEYAVDVSAHAADRALVPGTGLGSRSKIIVTIPVELLISAGGYLTGEMLNAARHLHPELMKLAQLNRNKIEQGEQPYLGQLPYGVPSPHAHGYGPIAPQAALELAAQASQWTTIITNPVTGVPIGVGKKNYRPTQLMRILLQLRDQYCRVPGCHKPAIACEIDHFQGWAKDGGTDLTNLWHLCHEHHGLKTAGVWKFRQAMHGQSGDIEIVLPDGRVLTSPTPEFEAGKRFDVP